MAPKAIIKGSKSIVRVSCIPNQLSFFVCLNFFLAIIIKDIKRTNMGKLIATINKALE